MVPGEPRPTSIEAVVADVRQTGEALERAMDDFMRALQRLRVGLSALGFTSAKPGSPKVDLNANSISFCDQTVMLSPREADIAFVLAEVYPHYVSRTELVRRVFGQRHVVDPDNLIRTGIERLRRRVAPLGLDVNNRRSGGYRFHVPR